MPNYSSPVVKVSELSCGQMDGHGGTIRVLVNYETLKTIKLKEEKYLNYLYKVISIVLWVRVYAICICVYDMPPLFFFLDNSIPDHMTTP